MTESFIELIQHNRPNLAKSSLKVYKSILTNLYRSISGRYAEPEAKWFFDNQKDILKYLKDTPRDARKLRLSALAVLTEQDPKISEVYKSQMNEDIRGYNNEQKLQQKTPKQEENWISQSEVEKIYQQLRIKTRPLIKKALKGGVSKSEHSAIQDYLMLSLFVLNPPRRSLDYTDFKLHEDPGTEWNGITKKKFIFNKYKTAKTYGKQVVDINPNLYTLINQWKRINPNQEWLLIGRTGNKLSVPEMTRRFNNIFGKNISVSMLRHIYISDKVLKNMPALNDLQETATEMGNSPNQAILYKKVD